MQITSRHIEITEAIRNYIEDKVGKVDQYFDNIVDVKVIIEIENSEHIAEAIVNVPGVEIVAKAEAENLYTAIDLMETKLVRQVRKYKDRLKSRNQVSY